MDSTTETTESGTPALEVGQFKESFETFNRIVNNLQRQYLSLERQYAEQGRRLEEINGRLRQALADYQVVTSFLNSILTSLTSGVVAVDRTGTISHFNPAAERITGVPAARALGKKYDEVIPARSGGRFSALDTVMSGVEHEAEEKVIVTATGEEMPVSVSTALLRDDQAAGYGAVEIFFDLTKTKRLEAEVSRVKTLAALGEMAATVAHEVRNPLGGIGGFAALLKRELEGDENKARLADKIITGVNTLNRTIAALLDYTRPEQMAMRPVPLVRLIRECIEYECADQNGAADAIDFRVQAGDDDLPVTCDAHLMRQVMLNLLRNSREAMPAGGRVTIRVERVVDSDDREVPGPVVRVEVEDTGEGIPDEIKDKIFRPFFSTKSAHNGAGLGLASVWKTIQAHRGKIDVESKPGKGALFRIILPSPEKAANR
jgi:PAS domain S-box-containing protein